MGVTSAESPPRAVPAPALYESPRDRLVSRGAWLAAVAFAVATAGAVDPAAAAALAALFLVLALALSGPAPLANSPRAARLAVGALLLACAIQLLPLPEPVRVFLAPGATAARADLRALGVGGGWAPISVDVGATVFEAILWAGAAALLALLSRPAGPPSGARLAVALLVALQVAAWGDLLLGTRLFPLTHIEDPWGVGQEALRGADFSGWLINRNHWAALGVVLWPIAAAWALHRTGVARGIGLVAAAAVTASVVATRSRAGLGVVGLQGLAIAALLAARSPRRVRLAAFAAIAGAVLLARGPIATFLERTTAADVLGRRDLYLATARMAADSPILGWGMGTFQSAYPAYQPEEALYKYSHAHCDPLEWVAGAGLLGLVACAALGARVVSGARDRGAPAFARVAWTLSVLGGAAAACVEFPLQVPALRFVWLGVLFAGPRALSGALARGRPTTPDTLETDGGRDAVGPNRTIVAVTATVFAFAGCGGGSGGGAAPQTVPLDSSWARRVGNEGATVGTDVAAYPDGSLVAVGSYDGNIGFSSGTNPPKTLAPGGVSGMYLARYDGAGGILWARRVVGSGTVQGMGVVTHGNGEFTVTGFFTGSATFGEGGIVQRVLTSSGSEDFFVARYQQNGSLLWAKQSVGAGYEESTRIAARADGSVVITGLRSAAATLGLNEANETTLPASPFGVAGFLACYRPSGALLWAKTFDATGTASGWGVAIYSDGGAAVCGSYAGAAVFGPGVGLTGVGASQDVFVARFDAAGNAVWARSAGGAGDDAGYGVAVVPGDAVRLVGTFAGSADFGTEGPAPQTLVGFGDISDGFAAGYDGTGLFQWATSFGSTGYDFATSVASFAGGTFAVAGTFAGDATFGLGESGEQHASTPSVEDHETFVVRFRSDGAVDWVVTSEGGVGANSGGTGVAAGADDTVLVTGYFLDRLTFAPGFFLAGAGDGDAFVARFNSNGVFFP